MTNFLKIRPWKCETCIKFQPQKIFFERLSNIHEGLKIWRKFLKISKEWYVIYLNFWKIIEFFKILKTLSWRPGPMHAYVYLCTCTYTHVRTMHQHAHVCAHTQSHARTPTYVCAHIHTTLSQRHLHMHSQMHTCRSQKLLINTSTASQLQNTWYQIWLRRDKPNTSPFEDQIQQWTMVGSISWHMWKD